MCSIYEAIRRVQQGENARLVLMDMVPNADDGGIAFNEEEEIDSDDEFEIADDDDDLESDDELEMRDLEVEAEEEEEPLGIDPDDIPESEE